MMTDSSPRPDKITWLKCALLGHEWEQGDHGYAECSRCNALVFGGYVD